MTWTKSAAFRLFIAAVYAFVQFHLHLTVRSIQPRYRGCLKSAGTFNRQSSLRLERPRQYERASRATSADASPPLRSIRKMARF